MVIGLVQDCSFSTNGLVKDIVSPMLNLVVLQRVQPILFEPEQISKYLYSNCMLYAHNPYSLFFCCGFVPVNFTFLLWGYLNGLVYRQSCYYLSASEVILKDMGKWITWIWNELAMNHSKTKYNKSLCIFMAHTIKPLI